MVIRITFLFLAFGSFAKAQDSSYAKHMEVLLAKIETKTITSEDKADLKSVAYNMEKQGQKLDDPKQDYEVSLDLLSKAIKIYKYLDDTFNLANNLKFRGYVLAKLKRFGLAKGEIKQAISLYRSKKLDWSIPDCNLYLSRVFDIEKKIDSAVYYCNLSLNYWESKNSARRVFYNQTMLISLFTKAGRLTEAKMLQEGSEIIAKGTKINLHDLIDFYVVSEALYKKTNDFSNSRRCGKLYADILTGFRGQGVTANSYFDNMP